MTIIVGWGDLGASKIEVPSITPTVEFSAKEESLVMGGGSVSIAIAAPLNDWSPTLLQTFSENKLTSIKSNR